ncbi:MAG: DegT/DnrJ/EryC1/StrS family aminotransferase [Paludibacteraceae bacterium]|nr:DegT/DnrJ/EryC1/StrS family aminotransferase [Paludibacteraceae bacterium]
MSRQRIYLCLAHMSELGMEQKFVQEAFDTNWVTPLGPNVTAFEHDLEQWLVSNGSSSKYVTALSSGTAALHLALLMSGVQKDDEVICQSFTFCASANPIVYLGARPVFVDSEKESWNMSPSLLKRAIEERISVTGKKPKAIVVTHLYGMPAKIREIAELSKSYEIPLIEDAAEALGSSYDGRPCGTWGDFGVFSFNGNKMITTSGGGALVSSSEELKQQATFLATQARDSFPYYHHTQIGYNYRLSNVCAGIGRGQMTVLNEHIAHHRRVASIYKEAFASVDGIEYHDAPSPLHFSNFWLSTILLAPSLHIVGQQNKNDIDAPNDNVEALRLALEKEQVESRPLWKPMHLQPIYRESPVYEDGIATQLFRCGLCLPSGPCVSDEGVRRVVDIIRLSIK